MHREADDWEHFQRDMFEADRTMQSARQAKLNELQGIIESMAYELGHSSAERNCSRAYDLLQELSSEMGPL
jgi:hypothetical protein